MSRVVLDFIGACLMTLSVYGLSWLLGEPVDLMAIGCALIGSIIGGAFSKIEAHDFKPKTGRDA